MTARRAGRLDLIKELSSQVFKANAGGCWVDQPEAGVDRSFMQTFVADIAAWPSFGTNTVNIATLPCADTIVEYTFVKDARKSRELLITLGTVKLKLASDG